MRNNLIEIIFSKACLAGQVELSVLRQFHYSNPVAFYKKIFNKDVPKSNTNYLKDSVARDILKRLPSKWTRNAMKMSSQGNYNGY